MKIEFPTKEKDKKYLKKWDNLENYVLQESSLRKLFNGTYPKNIEMDDFFQKEK